MDLLSLVVTILIVGLIVWLLLYVIDLIPLPAPFGQIARAVVIVIAVIWLIKILLAVTGIHLAV
jgi:hypothetical protein